MPGSGSQTCRSKASSPTVTDVGAGRGGGGGGHGGGPYPVGDACWRTSTTTCRRPPSPRRRSSRATPPACSSTAAPSGPPAHRHVRDLPELLRPGDLVVVNETRVIPARLRLRRATGGAAEVLLVEPRGRRHVAWRSCARAPSSATARCSWSTPTARRVVEVGTRARRPSGRAPPRARGRSRRGTARCRCRPTSPTPSPTRALPDRLRPPARARWRHRRPACTSRPSVLAALAERGVAVAPVELVVGLDTFKPVTADDPADHRMHSERYRVPPETMDGVPARRARGGGRHDDGAGAGERRRHRRARAAAPRCSSAGPYAVAGRRRAAHQLPPAPHDAADDDRRLRRAPVARPLRHGAGRGLPVPVLRRRHAPGARPRDGAGHARRRSPPTAPPAPAIARTARGTYRTPCFMPVGTRGAVKYLERRRLRAARRRDRAGQHLPPDAAARRRGGGGARRRGPVRRLGRPHAHRLGRLPGLLARPRRRRRRRHVPLHLRRLPPPPDAGVGGRGPGAARRHHPDGPRRVPGAAVAARGGARSPSSAPRRGPSGPAPPTSRPDQALFGIVQGGVDEALRRGVGPARRSISTSTATASAACRWGRPAPRCCRRWPPPSTSCPPTGPATSWAWATRRRWSRRSASASTSSTACCRPASAATAPPSRRRARSTCATPATPGPTSRSTPTCACAVCRRHTRGYLRHLLPGQRADGVPAGLAAQPGLDVRPAWTRMGTAIAAGTFDVLRAEIAGCLGRDRQLPVEPREYDLSAHILDVWNPQWPPSSRSCC